jgi:hypothetical protein
MADRIHTFDMLRLSRKPTRPGEEWQIVMRAGVDGVAFWGTGHRGTPLEIESVAIVADITKACELYTQYTTLRGLPAIEIEFASHQEPNTLYKVLDVQPLQGQVQQLLRGVKAGSNSNWQGWLVCSWLVFPINEVPP